MKNHYAPVTQRVWPALLWTILLMSHTAWGQSVPDSQWARLGKTLAITTDGNIVTTEQISLPPLTADKVIKYGLQGNQIWANGPLKGGFYIGGKVPTITDYESIVGILLAATTDGGVAVVGSTNFRGGTKVATKIDANGSSRRWEESNVFFTGDRPDDIIGTPGGGFIVLYTVIQSNAPTTTSVRKYDAAGNFSWVKQIAYPNPNPQSSDLSLTRGKSVINTPDGGYLIAGYFNASGTTGADVGWVAKLDGDGNVSWQKLLTDLPLSMNINGPLPGSIREMVSATDVIPAADGNGYALVGNALEPAKFPTATPAILELNADGSFKRARSIGGPATESFITLYTGSGGKKYYAVGNISLQNGSDPQISLVNPATLPLNDPALLKVEAQRTFNGPDDGSLVAIGVAGDGSLVFASSGNQVVKLVPEAVSPPVGALALTQPTYDCQTGAIVFNTTGGDGSPITYSAPGVSRSSATSNSGTVEPGLRNDPKPILITATQNGQTTSYTFDLKAACSGTPAPQPPVYSTIPDQFYTVGQSVNFPLGSYFNDPTTGIPGYTPNWSVSVTGLPEGLSIFSRNDVGSPNPTVAIVGTPRTTGVSTVTVTASTAAFPGNPIRTTFQMTISSDTPPPGGALTLTQPSYNCQTGAIVFNTTGGDGSPITYSAPGISRSSATSNSGTVEQGLRNDPKPLTIQATQNGSAVSYTFDFGAYCANPQPPQPPTPPTPPPGSALTLLAPTYDCGSGAIVFRTSGGNGSTIEYMAPGITGWTTNPNQFVDKDSRTANDVKPFTLMARQSGVMVSYVWDLKAACGRARTGADERGAALSVSVLGNPVDGRSAMVEIRGVSDQAVQVDLIDLQGRVLHQQRINQAGSTERVSVPAGNGNGMLLLNVSTATQRRQVKLLKP